MASTLKAKLFAQASVFPALQALLGTNPFPWDDGQLVQNALVAGYSAVVVTQVWRRPMWANLGQLPTTMYRMQFTIYGAVPDPNNGADSQSCDAVVGALQEFMPTFNATGIATVEARGNRLVSDVDGGLSDTQPRTFMRHVDYEILANDNV